MPDDYNWLDEFLATKKPPTTAPRPVLPGPPSNGQTDSYGRAALAGELEKLLGASEGGRNEQLNTSAFKLGQLVATGHLSEAEVIVELSNAAAGIGLSDSEIPGTVRSGMGSGQEWPREPEPLPVSVVEVSPDELGGTGEGTPDEPGSTEDRRYLQFSAAALDVDGLSNIKPGPPLVVDYLSKNSLAWLHGKPGAGKSFVAIEIACCVATGIPWHDHLTVKGRVLYVIAEGATGFASRVKAWIEENGLKPDGIRFLPVPVQLMQPIDVAAFARVLDDFRPTLIIFDTQARVTIGAEENSSKDMGRFIDALELLRARSGACVLTVHHEPRTGENLRGSTALEGAAMTVLRAAKEGEQVTVESRKQKDSVECEPLILTLEARGDSAVLVRAGMESRALTDSARKMLAVLAEFGDKWISKTTLADAVGFLSRATFYRALNELLKRHLVLEREDGRNRYSYRLPFEAENDLQSHEAKTL